MENKNLISVSGYLGSGKDEVGSIIQYLTSDMYKIDGFSYSEWLAYGKIGYKEENWKIKKFADKLKDIVCMLIGCTREQLENRDFKDSILGEQWWYYKISTGYPGKYNLIPYQNSIYSKPGLDSFIANSRYLVKPTVRELLQSFGTDAARNIVHPNIWVNALMSGYSNYTYNYKKYNSFEEAFKIFKTDGRNTLKKSYDFDTEYKNEPITKSIIDSQIVPNKWVVTDTRFPNELESIKSRGGITIRVNRYPNKIYASRGAKNTREIDFDPTNPVHMSHYLGDIKNKHESETALDQADFDYVIDNNGTLDGLKEKVKQILIEEGIL